jgi:hypothetical protein
VLSPKGPGTVAWPFFEGQFEIATGVHLPRSCLKWLHDESTTSTQQQLALQSSSSNRQQLALQSSGSTSGGGGGGSRVQFEPPRETKAFQMHPDVLAGTCETRISS